MKTKLYNSLVECKNSTILLDICLECLDSGYDTESILIIFDEYLYNNLISDYYEDTVYDIIEYLTYYKPIKFPIE